MEVHQNGSVVAKAAGSADAIATAVNGVSSACKVTVKAPTLTGITLNKAGKNLRMNQLGYGLSVSPVPANAELGPVTWSMSKPAIATVDSNGTITPVSVGVAVLTATVGDLNDTATVTIDEASDVPITGFHDTVTFDNWGAGWIVLGWRNIITPEDANDLRCEIRAENPALFAADTKWPAVIRQRLELIQQPKGTVTTYRLYAKSVGKPEMGEHLAYMITKQW